MFPSCPHPDSYPCVLLIPGFNHHNGKSAADYDC
nr:MAG TPA: hypothetical protein [Caudoviricetes sp.]